MTKMLAIISARSGSKGILRKNVRLLAGKPLIAHSTSNYPCKPAELERKQAGCDAYLRGEHDD